ncbi:MAG: ABC transporter ATP-binding protein [Candidatus Gastranaerophilales bacterium]|nr:ABC transporter ATP-binding protein [Candidatus Gastranaerophilales bacterium]
MQNTLKDSGNIIEINNLSLGFDIDENFYPAIHSVNFDIQKGKMHAIVGESGCGKTMTVMSILRLLPKNARITNGEILFEDKNLLELKEKDLRKIRGRKIALIPQDPMTSLNPLYTIENQMIETVLLHNKVSKKEAYEIALQSLKDVEIQDPENRMKAYPHELSGGMKQRVIIAMALSSHADVIIADEPTTALDVTIQAQILKLLSDIKKCGKSIILITHDLGIVKQYADFVSIMYLGKVVERAEKDTLFYDPKHPYTKALLAALPTIKGKKLENIKGTPSPITKPVIGCPYHPRCKNVKDICSNKIFPLKHQPDGSSVACRLYE